jgi:exosortase/archaeosortase family protein
MSLIKDRKFLWFVGKFLLLFSLFYFGTLAVIGLASPGKLHSPFIENYFDYVSWIKQSLIWAVGIMTHWFGYVTYTLPDFIIGIKNGASVKIAMDCVGYGVYSFWAAYVIANDGTWKKKAAWVAGGLLLLWLINAIRISLVLMALHERIAMPLGIDHHTWFNIIAYIAIFGMIWLFERRKATNY